MPDFFNGSLLIETILYAHTKRPILNKIKTKQNNKTKKKPRIRYIFKYSLLESVERYMGVILYNPKNTTTASFHSGMLALPGVPSFWFCWATLNLLCEGSISMWWFFYWNITTSYMLTTTETSKLQKAWNGQVFFFFLYIVYVYKLSKF